jgi:hypothetical protein
MFRVTVHENEPSYRYQLHMRACNPSRLLRLVPLTFNPRNPSRQRTHPSFEQLSITMPDTETRASEVFSCPDSATDSLAPSLSQLNVSIISGYSETSELRSTDISNADRHFPLVRALSTEFYPIRDSISRSLNLGSIFALTRVCKSLRGLYRDLKRTHWSIDNHLSHFFANANSFRNMMRACGAVVSGSSALQFFDRVYWRESDLDVYFDCSVNADPVQRMGKYLVDVEGYVFVPNWELGQVARWEDACGKLDPFTMTEIYANRYIRAV